MIFLHRLRKEQYINCTLNFVALLARISTKIEQMSPYNLLNECAGVRWPTGDMMQIKILLQIY